MSSNSLLQGEHRNYTSANKQESFTSNHANDEQLKSQILKQQVIFDRQGKDLQVQH